MEAVPDRCLACTSTMTSMSSRRTSRRTYTSPRMCLWTAILGCILAFTLPLETAAQQDGDIQQFLRVIGEKEGQMAPETVGQQALSVMWGLADATAALGKLFQYTLPTEAFDGEVTEYKVREWGQGELPSWLTFDPELRTLRGIPSEEETGIQQTIEVTAVSHHSDDMSSHAKDLFTINVVEDDTPVSTATPLKDATQEGLKPIRCGEGSPVTMVTIVVDTDLTSLDAHNKLSLVDGACQHLGLPPELLRLMPVGNRPMFDSSALVAGPGDVKQPKHPGATLQWAVGCGNVNAAHMPVLQQLEATSHDGSMSGAMGHGVIGWHVTNNRPNAPTRLRRQANIHHTPTINQGGPPTRQPVPTYTVDSSTDQPVTRVVPTMASPAFGGEIQPTKSHHHHRTKTQGRHQHRTKHHKPKHSPTNKHHHKTKYTRTPMPTPTVLPIQPTRVSDISSTILDTALERPHPTFSPSSPGVSRTETLLEPSMTPVLPPSQTSMTEGLPTRTYIIPPSMTTEPIRPSTTDGSTTTTSSSTREPPIDIPTTTHSTTTTPSDVVRPDPDLPSEFDYAPILRNDIDRLVVIVGDILNFTIPADTFFDFEDGNTRNLKLVFMTVDGLTVPRNSWVVFDPVSQVLYGLPLPEHEGRQEYIMAAIDRKGKIARDAFEIVVQRRPHGRKINHEFSVTLDLEYRQFLMNVNKRIEVASKIASVYGDENSNKITVTRIEQGSVIYAWTNNSLPYSPCPNREIGELLSHIMLKNNSVHPHMREKMHPYRILSVSAQEKGSCEPTRVFSPSTEGVPRRPEAKSNEDVLITTVIPAIVIAVMLLLAGCIACMLYRKNRRSKLSDEDQHTFVNKGIPIIFQDELEDKPDPPSKPLILANEKPPLPPPEYPRSGAGSGPSTPDSNHKDRYDSEDYHEDMTSPLYQPPPPFTGSRDMRQGRPRTQQASYRNPPPYVPP